MRKIVIHTDSTKRLSEKDGAEGRSVGCRTHNNTDVLWGQITSSHRLVLFPGRDPKNHPRKGEGANSINRVCEPRHTVGEDAVQKIKNPITPKKCTLGTLQKRQGGGRWAEVDLSSLKLPNAKIKKNNKKEEGKR